ncbi:MAG: hypothetical protein JKX87_06275 [Cycloclasticus sp.]|nr:hypothetical protein [Cycloclasticus sp.]
MMFISKQDIIKEMANNPDRMAQQHIDVHERVEQLVKRIESLEHSLRNPRSNFLNKTG